jgi:hypothetical protein
MYRKLAIAILALSVGAGLVLALSASSAQAQQQQQKKAQGQSRPSGNAGASRGAARTGGPSAGRAAIQSRARTVTQSSPRNVTQSRARTVTQGSARAITQSRVRTQGSARSTTRRGVRTVTKQVVAPAAAAKVVAPSGANARVVTASRLRGVPARGAGRTSIRGQNFSAWRRGYRVRHGNGWSTFVALSALSAIAIGSNNYYPYAYISAPQDYCDGLTEDGCQLMWQQVQTDEGDLVYQCVAYCPWQQ